MKTLIYKLTLVLAGVMLLVNTGCKDELAELNQNPNAINDLDYGMQLTQMQLATSGGSYEIFRTAMGYCFSSIQQMADIEEPSTGVFLPGDKYLDDPLFAAAFFNEAYAAEYKNITDYLLRTGKDPEAKNHHAIGRIWRVISAHRITDIYGDVPYFDAGKGYSENNWFPAYDPQEDIYADMLKELEEAAMQLTPAQDTPGENDLLYAGDTDKWKKLAYSMMLRLGMRLTKVDVAEAELWVKKAIAGGVMTSNDDVARIYHETGGHRNPYSAGFETRDRVRLSATFIDWMADNNDPRLDIISHVESGGPHKGLPNGHDISSLQNYAGGTDLATYSRVNPDLLGWDAPSFYQTYAEVELLLAEAAVRGWHTGDPATHYQKGVRAAIENWGLFDIAMPASSEIDDYLTANPYDPAKGLEMIGEQYWAATFLQSWEGYSNWRRTGYPSLTPVNYPGNATNGQIPRRLTYSADEYSINPDNVKAAVARQGADSFMTRVWWDKE